MNALNNWLKENHEDIYDEYLKTLTNIERERERVILAIPSIYEFEKGLNSIGNNVLNHNLNYGRRINSGQLITVSNIYQNNSTIYNIIKEFYYVYTNTANAPDDNGAHSVNYNDTRYYDKTGVYSVRLANSTAYGRSSFVDEYNGIRLKLIYKE